MTGASLPRPIGRQREVLYLPAQDHVVVLGTAGSGKTTLPFSGHCTCQTSLRHTVVVHSAKGLEFDSVFLPLLSDDHWPDRRDVRDIGEQEATIRDARLLYVGITRARSSLILTFTGRMTRLLPTSEDLYQV